MTVKQLQQKLRKMPPNAKVYLAMHDNGAYEVAADCGGVYLMDRDNASENERLQLAHFNQHLPDEYVVLRP